MKELGRKIFTVCVTIPVCVLVVVGLGVARACIYVSDGHDGDPVDFMRARDK